MIINNTKTPINKTYRTWFVRGTLAAALLLVSAMLAGAETTKKFEPEQLREDFRVARQSLEEGHPGSLYLHTKKIELDEISREGRQKVLEPPHGLL